MLVLLIISQSLEADISRNHRKPILDAFCSPNSKSGAKFREVFSSMDPPELPAAVLARKAADHYRASGVLVDKVRTVVDNIVNDYPYSAGIAFGIAYLSLGNEWHGSVWC